MLRGLNPLNLFRKKNKKNMFDENKLISYKQNFTGKKFQWIKPESPDLLGKVVTCRDVDFAPSGQIVAIFDDGSRIDASKINSNLMMIHGDMQPLSKEEVSSIYGPTTSRSHISKEAPKVASEPVEVSKSPSVQSQDSQPTVNPFEMFNSEEIDFSIKLKVKMPDRKLLKLMYQNAEDKDKFLDNLADHLMSSIDNKSVRGSITSMLETKKG